MFFVEVSNVASMFVQNGPNISRILKAHLTDFDCYCLPLGKFAEGPQHRLTDSQIIPDHPRSKKVQAVGLFPWHGSCDVLWFVPFLSISWWSCAILCLYPAYPSFQANMSAMVFFTARRSLHSPRIRTTQRLTQMITTGTPVRRVGRLWIFWMKPDTLGVVLLIRTCWNHFRSAHCWDVAANAVAWTQQKQLSCSKPLQNRRSRGFWWILDDFGIFRL